MLKFFRLEDMRGLTIAHFIQWENGYVSVKFTSERFPATYSDLETLLLDIHEPFKIFEEGQFNDDITQ
jgi:hypothetical protein